MSHNILIFGPQGSGKGTQAQILKNNLNIPHISTGNIFRDHIKRKTELGIKISNSINQGNLVPDEVTNQIVKERLEDKDCANGYILDGFPRNINQAEFLTGITTIDFALEIWLSDEEAIKRISNRRSCNKCGAIYHLISNPPATENKCDKCEGKLIIRKDDEPESIKKRLAIYHKQTENLIEYYKKLNVFHKIDGSLSINEVNNKIAEIL